MSIFYQWSAWFGQGLSSALWAVMVACLLPYAWTIIAKKAGGFRPSDNANPRAFLANVTGLAARANAAQANSFESLPFFVAGVLLAVYTFVPQQVVNGLAWLYVALRVCYGLAYLLNAATLRSILWALSMATVVMLFSLAIKMV